MIDQFSKDICRAAGHEWIKDPNLFANVCRRCEEVVSWMDKTAMTKIASAMATPLKTSLDYEGIARKITKIDVLEQSDLPVYDADLPAQKLKEDICSVVGHEFKRLDALVSRCKRCDHCTQAYQPLPPLE